MRPLPEVAKRRELVAFEMTFVVLANLTHTSEAHWSIWKARAGVVRQDLTPAKKVVPTVATPEVSDRCLGWCGASPTGR